VGRRSGPDIVERKSAVLPETEPRFLGHPPVAQAYIDCAVSPSYSDQILKIK